MADFSGGPGFLAFVATLLLVAGVIVLLRSLNKHLRKVRVNPPAEAEEGASGDLPTDAPAADSAPRS